MNLGTFGWQGKKCWKSPPCICLHGDQISSRGKFFAQVFVDPEIDLVLQLVQDCDGGEVQQLVPDIALALTLGCACSEFKKFQPDLSNGATFGLPISGVGSGDPQGVPTGTAGNQVRCVNHAPAWDITGL